MLWRQTHLGHLLTQAGNRFEQRVLQLMADDETLPLRWTHRIESARITAAQVHITRHLPREGARLVDLAQAAGMTKQAMAALVGECEVLGLIQREATLPDARAKRIVFTETGLLLLTAYERAVAQAQEEFRAELGADVATVLLLGLEAYAAGA
ncbi:MAG: MarR family winged helix-turn-helix transcriptional regulator [Burkholderiaceae bacterium]